MTSIDQLLKPDPPRDRWGRYLVRLPGDKKPRGRTRVTTFIKSLDQGDGLIAWKATACMVGALRNPGLHAKWAALFAESSDPWYASDDLKTKCKKLVDECADHGGAQSRADLGTALHTMLELVARGEQPELVEPYASDVAAWRATLAAARLTPHPHWTEVCVYIERYDLVGTFDGLFSYGDVDDGDILLGDLKTETSTDYKALNHAAQLAAYSLATHRIIFPDDPEDECTLEPLPDFDRDTGLIVHLPAGQARCTIHAVDLAQGREALEVAAACRRLDAQRKRKDTGGLMRPWTGQEAGACGATSPKAPSTSRGDQCDTTTPATSTAGTSTGKATPKPTTGTTGMVNETAVPTTTTPAATTTTTTNTSPASTATAQPTTGTPTQEQLKTRLRQIRVEQPPLAAAITQRWPIRRTLAEPWDTNETTAVAMLLHEVDVEGPAVDQTTADQIYQRLNQLEQPQLARVVAWNRDAAQTGRGFTMKGGNTTTRRAALLDACIHWATSDLDNGQIYLLLEEIADPGDISADVIGRVLGNLTWREAVTLQTITRQHLNLNATIINPDDIPEMLYDTPNQEPS